MAKTHARNISICLGMNLMPTELKTWKPVKSTEDMDWIPCIEESSSEDSDDSVDSSREHDLFH